MRTTTFIRIKAPCCCSDNPTEKLNILLMYILMQILHVGGRGVGWSAGKRRAFDAWDYPPCLAFDRAKRPSGRAFEFDWYWFIFKVLVSASKLSLLNWEKSCSFKVVFSMVVTNSTLNVKWFKFYRLFCNCTNNNEQSYFQFNLVARTYFSNVFFVFVLYSITLLSL